MVRDALAVVDAEAAPAGALSGLEALEQVEEGDGRVGVFGVAVLDVGEDCGASVGVAQVRWARGEVPLTDDAVPFTTYRYGLSSCSASRRVR